MSTEGSPAAAPDQAALFQLISTPPAWLTKEYFTKALQDYEKDKSLEIISYGIAPATKPGENFASIVFRATVSYVTRGKENSNVQFIVKVEPFVEGPQKAMMGCGQQFETESQMYAKTLPAMQHLLKSIGDTEILAPELVFASLEPKIIILKDISVDGFVMEKKGQGLDAVTKVMKKLAKFHALSYFLQENNVESVSQYTEGFMNERMQGNVAFVNQMSGLAIAVLKGWGKEMEVVVERLTALLPVMFQKLCKIYAPGNGLNVLVHGDFHLRNLLFKWTQGPEQVAEALQFIDFQFCFYGSPAVDILWALYFVANHETRENHREELVQIYHEAFAGTLKSIGFLKTVPSLLDVNVELLKYGLLEAFAVLGPLPVFFVDIQEMMAKAGAGTGEAPSMEMMFAMGQGLLEQPEIKKVVMAVLPKLLFQGSLE